MNKQSANKLKRACFLAAVEFSLSSFTWLGLESFQCPLAVRLHAMLKEAEFRNTISSTNTKSWYLYAHWL